MSGFESVAIAAPSLAFRDERELPGTGHVVPDWFGPESGIDIAQGVRIWYVPHAGEERLQDYAGLTAEDCKEFSVIRDRSARQRSLATREALRLAL
ncbi:MAG: hypothetical protein ABWZ86_05445, partial [Hyphomicrobium sp.]